MKKNHSDKVYEAPFADADPAGVCDKDTADGNASGAISFENLFDLEEIQHLQDLFANATGIACQIQRPDGTFITERSNYCRLCGDIIRGNEKGLAKCTESDTSLRQLNSDGLNIYRCGSAGLLEAGAPICVDGKHIATWGLGQVCDGTQTEAGIRAYAREIGADEDAAADAFKHVTVMSRERFEEVARMMHAVANQLATTGYQNLRQASLMEEHERTKEKLAQFEGLLEAEDVLQRDRDRLDYVIDASRLGTWAWNIKENTAEFNEMWATLLGYTMNEIGPSSYELWKSLGHPEDVPKIEALLQQCASGEVLDYSSEFRMRHKDGHWVWILDRGRVMTYDAEGRPLEMFGTHTDITPLMQAEEELRQSEAKFRSYVEQAPFGVFIVDETGHYLDINPAASQLAGYTRDELLTMSIRHMVPPDGREAGAAHFAQVVKQGFADGVLPHVRKDGTRRLWNVTAVRFNKEHVLGFVQDVTEREQMEKQVRAAQKLDAVGQLAGGVAHDFNNLLMGIMGYTELCLDELEEENPIRQWLDEIMHEAKRSADIVRQLLAFSRKQTIAPRILNLNDAVENMLKMLRRLIGEDIDLLWQPRGRLGAIKIDPGQVDQILANLCVNARDAIGGVGKIVIETANTPLDEDYCATHAEVQPGDFVMLAVSDSGSGMDAETQASVFEPFFTTKAEGEGTGLGLATVYGIVKQNGGSINLYSEPGEGTTFRIYLPCCESSENVASAKKGSSTAQGGNETLLVVEDQQAICRIIRRFLKPLGYTVYTAESPVRALEIMDESGGEIDVLITDVVMPGMNGRELAEKLQAMKPELKVLYMSGYTANVIAHRGILEEGVNFLSKPITRDQLARKLRNMLG